MDPIALAAAVVPFLVRVAAHLVGVAGDAVDGAIPDVVQTLWETVKARFAGDELASGALDRLEQQPDNPKRQAAVEDHLAEKVEGDPRLASLLADLVHAAQSLEISSVSIVDSGAAAIGGHVTITAGANAAGRDLTISDSDPAPKATS